MMVVTAVVYLYKTTFVLIAPAYVSKTDTLEQNFKNMQLKLMIFLHLW